MTHFNYKNYQGSVKVSIEDHCLHGKIEFISDLVNYEADTVEQLELEFRKAVDNYLETCAQVGMEPKKPFIKFAQRQNRSRITRKNRKTGQRYWQII